MKALRTLVAGQPLDRPAAEAVMEQLLTGQVPEAASGALLAALAIRGVTAPTLAGFATVM
ncbi:MAG: hypothetical protein KC583_00170, partial [Myxococcales bacterium]|nr:hypothetical protein [Myxococcales bacterium]